MNNSTKSEYDDKRYWFGKHFTGGSNIDLVQQHLLNTYGLVVAYFFLKTIPNLLLILDACTFTNMVCGTYKMNKIKRLPMSGVKDIFEETRRHYVT